MKSGGLTEVLFCTLTRPNGQNPKRLVSDTKKFCTLLSRVTKSHLIARCGGDLGHNLHFHVVISCLDDDLSRFKRLIGKFDPVKANRWDLDFQEWCPDKGERAWVYLYNKEDHTDHETFKFCPKQKRSCKRSDVCEFVSAF